MYSNDTLIEIIETFIEKFLDDALLEDLIDLKRTMSQNEINSYIKEKVKDMAVGMSPTVSTKMIPLKKTYHLKVTVEREEMSDR